MSREGSHAKRSDNPRSVITKRSNLNRFKKIPLTCWRWPSGPRPVIVNHVFAGSNPVRQPTSDAVGKRLKPPDFRSGYRGFESHPRYGAVTER
jgi:hypothetical protein